MSLGFEPLLPVLLDLVLTVLVLIDVNVLRGIGIDCIGIDSIGGTGGLGIDSIADADGIGIGSVDIGIEVLIWWEILLLRSIYCTLIFA